MIKLNRKETYFSFIILAAIYITPYLIIAISPNYQIFSVNNEKFFPTQDEFAVYAARAVKFAENDILGDHNIREYSGKITPYEKFPPIITGLLIKATNSLDTAYIITIFLTMTLTLIVIYETIVLFTKPINAAISACFVFFSTNFIAQIPQIITNTNQTLLWLFSLNSNYNLRFYNNAFGILFLFIAIHIIIRVVVFEDKRFSSVWAGLLISIGAFYTYMFLTLFIPLLLIFSWIYAIISKREKTQRAILKLGLITLLFGIPQIGIILLSLFQPGHTSVITRLASYGSFFHLYNVYATIKYLTLGGILYYLGKNNQKMKALLMLIITAGILIIDQNIITGFFFIQEHMETRVLEPLLLLFFAIFVNDWKWLQKTMIVWTIIVLIIGFPLHAYTLHDTYKNQNNDETLSLALKSINTSPSTILTLGFPETYHITTLTPHYVYLPYVVYSVIPHEEVLKRIGYGYGFLGINRTYLKDLLYEEKAYPNARVTGNLQEDEFEHHYFGWTYWNTTWHPINVTVVLTNIVPHTSISEHDKSTILSAYDEQIHSPILFDVDYTIVGPFEKKHLNETILEKRKLQEIYHNENYTVYKNLK